MIFGSGPLAVRGLRDARDLDIVVTKDVYDMFREKDGWSESSNGTDTCLRKDDMELWYTWGPGEWHVEELLANAEMIDGLPFVPLPVVLRWKEVLGRPKDRADIETIRKHLTSV